MLSLLLNISFALSLLGNEIVRSDEYISEKWRSVTGKSEPKGGYEKARKTITDAEGNVITAGLVYEWWEDTARCAVLVQKLAAENGALIWEKRYPVEDGWVFTIDVNEHGEVVVLGLDRISRYDYLWNQNHTVTKFGGADGAKQWVKRFLEVQGVRRVPNNAVIDGSGNVVIGGRILGDERQDYFTAKYHSASGLTVWEHERSGNSNEESQMFSNTASVDRSGNVLIGGIKPDWVGSGYISTAVKYSSNGEELGHWQHQGPHKAMVMDESGGVAELVAWQNRIIKRDANGVQLLSVSWGRSLDFTDHWQQVAIAPNGDVALGGYSYDTNKQLYFYAVKISGADGVRLWERRIPFGVSSHSEPDGVKGVTMDRWGNVIITATKPSSSISKATDWLTVKFASVDGMTVWTNMTDPRITKTLLSRFGWIKTGIF